MGGGAESWKRESLLDLYTPSLSWYLSDFCPYVKYLSEII